MKKYRPLMLVLPDNHLPTLLAVKQFADKVIGQGTIDGQENPVSVIDAQDPQHKPRYLSMLNYTYGSHVPCDQQ